VRANGQLAFGKYSWSEERGAFTAHSITVLTLDDEGIADITSFIDPALVPSFGLPEQLAP
jgi:RNA polymerase sigma-70 factor (ECF subfamily)